MSLQDRQARKLINRGGIRAGRISLAALRADGRYTDEQIKKEWQRIGIRPDIIEELLP